MLASVIEPIGGATPASLSLESKMLGAPFDPSTADCQADLVDQAGPQEGPVRAAATFEQQAFDAQFAVQDLQSQPQIELPLAGEDVGDAILAQARQMCVGDLLRQHRDNRVTADLGASPGDLALGVEHDPIRGGIAPGEPRLPRKTLIAAVGVGS